MKPVTYRQRKSDGPRNAPATHAGCPNHPSTLKALPSSAYHRRTSRGLTLYATPRQLTSPLPTGLYEAPDEKQPFQLPSQQNTPST